MAKDVILLVCTAGISTNLLIAQMQHLADIQGVDLDIFATNASEFDQALKKYPVRVVLLSPQLRYLKERIATKLAGKEIPIAVISMQDYGNLNSKNILAQALSL